MILHQPSGWALLLLPVALLALLWAGRDRRRGRLTFPEAARVRGLPRSFVARTAWLPGALRGAALAALVVALARPQTVDERRTVFTEGIAIQLVVDRSGSMEALDFSGPGEELTRLDVVKDVVSRFVLGGGSLRGRPSDLVGLVTFATWADASCPLTLDHAHLVRCVQDARVPTAAPDRGTAIGDATALAVERMRALEDLDPAEGAPRIRGKVIVLLTDGENTAGEIEPIQAAQIAAAFGIRIYAIGAGTQRGFAPVPSVDPLTGRRAQVPVGLDEETLKAMAAETGGAYFRADDRASLESIYAKIDELERSEIRDDRYVELGEAAIRPWRLGALALPPIVLVALVALVLESTLAWTRYARLGE